MIVSRSQKNECGRKCGRKRLQYTWGVRMGMVVDGWVFFMGGVYVVVRRCVATRFGGMVVGVR